MDTLNPAMLAMEARFVSELQRDSESVSEKE